MSHKKGAPVVGLALLLALAVVSEPLAAFLVLQPVLAQSPAPSFSPPDVVPKGTTIKIDGSSSLATINQSLKKAYEAKYAGTSVTLAEAGSDAAIKALLDGSVNLAAIGRPLTAAEKQQGLSFVPIARHKIAIMVGPDNPFTGNITFEQFAKIFRGEIKDWSELGGAPGPIRFIDRPEFSDTRQAFRSYPVFQQAPFKAGDSAQTVSKDSTDDVIQALGKDGIGYAIADQVIDRKDVKIVPMHKTLPDDPRYPFSQPLAYVYKGTPSPAVLSFLSVATAATSKPIIEAARETDAKAAAIASPEASPSAAASPAASPSMTPNPETAAVPSTAGAAETHGLSPWWLLLIPLLGIPLWLWLRGRRGAVEPITPPPVAAPPTPPPTVAPPTSPPAVSLPDTEAVTPPPAAAVSTGDAAVVGGAALAAGAAGLAGSAPESNDSVPEPPPADPIPDLPVAPVDSIPAAGIAEPPPADPIPDRPVAPVEGIPAAGTLEPPPADPIPADPALGGAALAGAAALAAGAGAAAFAGQSGNGEAGDRSKITLTPHQGNQALAEWDAPEAHRAELRHRGGRDIMLRLYDVTGLDLSQQRPQSFQEFRVTEDTSNYTGPVRPDRDYIAEIGYLTGDRYWLPLARSNSIRVPSLSAPPSATEGATAGGATLAAGAGLAALASLSGDKAQSDVEASKYDVGQSDLSSEALASVDEGLPSLPDGYGESRIVLMPRDPQWGYTYWDTPGDHKEELRRQGGQRLALRLYDVTDLDINDHSPHSLQQYDVDELTRDWYVPIPVSDRDYVAEIGYLTGDGRWLLLARSNPVRIPPVYPSDWFEDHFVSVAWDEDLRGKTVLELIPPNKRGVGDSPIYDQVFGLAQSTEALRVAGSLFGSMQHVVGSGQQIPQQAVSSFVFPSGAGMWAAPGIPGLTASGIGMSGIGMSGIGFGASMPPLRARKFWLVADAELIVYGATEPDATVTIDGRPIQLNPDGTFRFQLSFQDGVLNFPIVAVAADGEQTRAIHLRFKRETPHRQTNTKDEAIDELF